MNKVKKILISKVFIITLLFTVAAFLGLIGYRWLVSRGTISSIAYNGFENKENYRVYIKEYDRYVPFLVIDNEYAPGSTLLLREEILSEERRMNDYSSYYKDSEIDIFLNGFYYDELKVIHHLIKNTSVEIIKDEAIGSTGEGTENINRNIFLLSEKELAYSFGVEGKELQYFHNPENRLCYLDGEPVGWLLRTPATPYFSVVSGITYDGMLSSDNSFNEYGIRPAFCVDSSAKIKKKEGIVNGKKVYVLE